MSASRSSFHASRAYRKTWSPNSAPKRLIPKRTSRMSPVFPKSEPAA